MQSTLFNKISSFGRFLKMSSILMDFIFWALFVSGLWLVFFLLDNLLGLPPGLRLPLSFAGALVMSATFVRKILLPSIRTIPQEQSAIEMEKKFHIPHNMLINSCQLARNESIPKESRKFVEMTLKASESMVEGRSFIARNELAKFARWAAMLLIALMLWALYVATYPNFAANALLRFVMPMRDLPPASATSIKLIPDDNITVFQGEDVTVRCAIGATRAGDGQESVSQIPKISWMPGKLYVQPMEKNSQSTFMKPIPQSSNAYGHVFANVQNSFAFRVFAGTAYSRSISVKVLRRPEIVKSQYVVVPPAYTGGVQASFPGPPATLSCLPESEVSIQIQLDKPVVSMHMLNNDSRTEFTGANEVWKINAKFANPVQFQIYVEEKGSGREIPLCACSVNIQKDRPPLVEFLTEDRNRLLSPGAPLELDIEAIDDFGLRNISVLIRDIEHQAEAATLLRAWNYIGPPGRGGRVKETFSTHAAPPHFNPGSTYLLQAAAFDFSPSGVRGESKPIVLRIRTVEEVSLSNDDPLHSALELLKQTIKEQRKANFIGKNLLINIEDILKDPGNVGKHAKSIADQQSKAREYGRKTVAALEKVSPSPVPAGPLKTIVEGEMGLLLDSIEALKNPVRGIEGTAGAIVTRQEYILEQLILLIGRMSSAETVRTGKASDDPGHDTKPLAETEDSSIPFDAEASMLEDILKDYLREQKKILEASKQLMDRVPEDLTEEEEKIIGELAREQSKWADLFEEKLTDWSKLPGQDFSDSSIAQEFNEIFQEVKLAEKSLYEKKVDIAVPHEQAGIEAAEELVHNLEKWLPDTPDFQKWSMEDPEAPLNVPLAELPDELEDIFGELLDSEEEMTEEVEDVTSQWMDSLDKGAGWDAADGSISNLSAKGVTGNRLPNEHEVGGRAGEGRTGRSHGQIVEETAVGKDGRQTPSRLTPSPFEQGSIQDSSKTDSGGATGGGKLSGFTTEGLRGPAPPEMRQRMERLAQQQFTIRQQAETLALKLAEHNLPSGDLGSAIVEMKSLEDAARNARMQGISTAHSRALDGLKAASSTFHSNVRARNEKIGLPKAARLDIQKAMNDEFPKGYKDIISEYFKALSTGER